MDLLVVSCIYYQIALWLVIVFIPLTYLTRVCLDHLKMVGLGSVVSSAAEFAR